MHHRGRPRRRSLDVPGHAHELTSTCYRRYRFLSAERTCVWLAQAIDSARTRLDFHLWAYVFMPEHVHLIVWPGRPECRVSAILSAIKEPVGRQGVPYVSEHAPQWLARMTRKRGQRVEACSGNRGGGYDRNIWEPKTLMAMIDYLHANPVRRGLVERASDWRWSSASWFHEEVDSCGLIPDRIPPEWWP